MIALNTVLSGLSQEYLGELRQRKPENLKDASAPLHVLDILLVRRHVTNKEESPRADVAGTEDWLS